MNNTQDVLTYLNSLDSKEKEILGELRKQILKLMPDSEERLSRSVPFFYYKNKRVVGFRSSKNHLSFFIMEGKEMNALRKEMTGFESSSTVIRFPVENPIPEWLVEKLVLARITEIERTFTKNKQ